jgi:hypothetical protein
MLNIRAPESRQRGAQYDANYLRTTGVVTLPEFLAKIGKFCVTGVKVLAGHGQMHTTISYMF